jgi:uncharacterized membrane-anchored protein
MKIAAWDIRMWVLGLAGAAQLAVPAEMIWRRERTLREGEAFLFKVQPVDPYDAFRGRYVSLGLRENSAPAPAGGAVEERSWVYAEIGRGADGFARFVSVRREKPAGGAWVRCQVDRLEKDRLRLRSPWDRYYMDEERAPEAEKAVRQAAQPEEKPAWIRVRVRSGDTAIEELFIDGRPVRDCVDATKGGGRK